MLNEQRERERERLHRLLRSIQPRCKSMQSRVIACILKENDIATLVRIGMRIDNIDRSIDSLARRLRDAMEDDE
jgi:mRNA-degrading endonuclease RelE of RelBE toxin-antitoxin system